MTKYFPRRGTYETVYRALEVSTPHKKLVSTFKARVCERCNSAWMNRRIEEPAQRSPLARMIDPGEIADGDLSIRVALGDQRALAKGPPNFAPRPRNG